MKRAATYAADRLKRLPCHHRIAHLRALIGLQPAGCGRRDELSELPREEMADASIEQVCTE
jgi:GcrA cell cycle regulator